MREDERKFVEELEQENPEILTYRRADLNKLIAIIRRQQKVIEKCKEQRDKLIENKWESMYRDARENNKMIASEKIADNKELDDILRGET